MPTPIRATVSAIVAWGVGRSCGISTLSRVAQANDDIVGRASVIDGDTVEIRGQRIRLWGIDAPEGQQRCVKDGKLWRAHADSANALDAYLADRPITCKQKDIDRYKRVVAICMVDGEDIGGWMVRMGWAFDFTRYSNGYYARGAGRGTGGSPRLMAGRVRDALGVEAKSMSHQR